jgi:hypothetical protein
MHIVRVIGLVLGGVLLASCASSSGYIADNLPEWAGGLPKGTPPRPGAPGYDDYLRGIHGGDHPTIAPATEAQSYTTPQPPVQPDPSPPRQPRQPVDDPVH